MISLWPRLWLSLEREKITRESVGKITVIGENEGLAKITQEQRVQQGRLELF